VQGNIFILAAASNSQSNPLGLFLPLIVIVGAFYFFLIRPQRNKQRQQQQMQKTLEPGTRVITTSGMYATVVEVNDDGVVLEIVPGVEAQFVAQAIMRVLEDTEDTEDSEDADDQDAEEQAEGEQAEGQQAADEQAEGEAGKTPVKDVEAKTAPPSLAKSDDKTDDKA
jgi:preprotein translocase subunit YajC